MRQYIANNITKSLNTKKCNIRPKNFNYELPVRQSSKSAKYHDKSKKTSYSTEISKEILIADQPVKISELTISNKGDMKFFSIDSKTCAQYAYLSSLNKQPSNNENFEAEHSHNCIGNIAINDYSDSN